MISINEWFPNPVGADAKGEFFELYNSGPSDLTLKGWKIEAGKKKYLFSDVTAPAGGYLVFSHDKTKLLLANTNGELALYNSAGRLVDRESFTGSAPEGKSFSRVDSTNAPLQHFAFVTPTPGAKNTTLNNEVMTRTYPAGTAFTYEPTGVEIVFMVFGTGALVAGLILYIIRSHEDLSLLFFGRDSGDREKTRATGREKI